MRRSVGEGAKVLFVIGHKTAWTARLRRRSSSPSHPVKRHAASRPASTVEVRHFRAHGPDFGRCRMCRWMRPEDSSPRGPRDEITTEGRSSTVVMAAGDRRRRADRRRRNVYVGTRRRAAMAVATTRNRVTSQISRNRRCCCRRSRSCRRDRARCAPFHGSGPSATVENELVSASRSIKTIGDSANYPTLAKAKSELATGARQFHVVSTVRNASQLSIAESPGHNQFVLVGTSNGTCLGMAMHGIERSGGATVRNVPIAPGVTYAHWTMPTSGCSAGTVPAHTSWGISFMGAK